MLRGLGLERRYVGDPVELSGPRRDGRAASVMRKSSSLQGEAPAEIVSQHGSFGPIPSSEAAIQDSLGRQPGWRPRLFWTAASLLKIGVARRPQDRRRPAFRPALADSAWRAAVPRSRQTNRQGRG
jgi:hypothetical protein